MITDAEGLTCMLLGTTSRMAAASMKPAPSETSEFRTGLRTSLRDDMIHPPIRFARDAAMPRTKTVDSGAFISDWRLRIVDCGLRIEVPLIVDRRTESNSINPQSPIRNPQSEIRNQHFRLIC